jgi:hypothetical protein
MIGKQIIFLDKKYSSKHCRYFFQSLYLPSHGRDRLTWLFNDFCLNCWTTIMDNSYTMYIGKTSTTK